MILLALLSAAALDPGPADAADPLGPAGSGQLQCYRPDRARKTCFSLAAYRAAAGGGYVNAATIPISPDGVVTLTTETPVRVVAGAVCGAIRAEDIARGTINAGGTAVTPEQAAPLLAQVATMMAGLIGREICTRYEPAPDGDLLARVTIDGAEQPNQTQRVAWVGADEGYRIVP